MTPSELKRARKALGLSQKGLASALGYGSGTTVYDWERG
jgi:DNA-binding transcriptional regulator YiaG